LDPETRSTSATNVLLLLLVVIIIVVVVLLVWVVVIGFSKYQGCVVSQSIVVKLFMNIDDNILPRATLADF